MICNLILTLQKEDQNNVGGQTVAFIVKTLIILLRSSNAAQNESPDLNICVLSKAPYPCDRIPSVQYQCWPSIAPHFLDSRLQFCCDSISAAWADLGWPYPEQQSVCDCGGRHCRGGGPSGPCSRLQHSVKTLGLLWSGHQDWANILSPFRDLRTNYCRELMLFLPFQWSKKLI